MNIETISNKSSRIDYIDLLKGFTILWIVWWHAGCPPFAQPYYHVPIFFFLSGLFFKKRDGFKNHLKRTTKHIGIPFLFFYAISYPYRMIVYLWDHKTLVGFRWNCILDLFKIEWRADYLYVNVPLWFLMCLFSLQIIYFFINKLPDWIIWIIALCSAATYIYTQHIPTPFMLNDAMHYLTYFAVGNLIGQKLLLFLKNNRNRIVLVFSCIILYVIIKLFAPLIQHEFINNISSHLLTFVFIFLIIALFSFIRKVDRKNILRFYGLNSLSVLGLHVPVLIVFQRIMHKLFDNFGLEGAFVCTVLTIITLYPFIVFINKHLPFCIGKNSNTDDKILS